MQTACQKFIKDFNKGYTFPIHLHDVLKKLRRSDDGVYNWKEHTRKLVDLWEKLDFVDLQAIVDSCEWEKGHVLEKEGESWGIFEGMDLGIKLHGVYTHNDIIEIPKDSDKRALMDFLIYLNLLPDDIECTCDDPQCPQTGQESDLDAHIEDCPCRDCHHYFGKL